MRQKTRPKPNLPALTMETAHEVSVRAHSETSFADRYLEDLNTRQHAMLHDMVITGANELAGDDPILAANIRRFGCQLLNAVDIAATIQDMHEQFGEPVGTV